MASLLYIFFVDTSRLRVCLKMISGNSYSIIFVNFV